MSDYKMEVRYGLDYVWESDRHLRGLNRDKWICRKVYYIRETGTTEEPALFKDECTFHRVLAQSNIFYISTGSSNRVSPENSKNNRARYGGIR